ncbi:hypothetical protein diail_7905 [Diaporthe ilicicola]|nr:hypothetical protein diail_7905 [Diaporthe ilicicola]
MITRRTWYMIPLLIGCLFECFGYLGRALASAESPDYTLGPYIMQSLLLLLGPTLLAASIYMMLGRLIVLLEADELSLIRPNWLTKVFVAGDVLSFFAQSGGGGMLAQAKTADDVKRGENIILGGLGIQILFFGFFMIAILVFHWRIRSNPTRQALALGQSWQTFVWILYATSILIMVRSMFRVAEYVQGREGSLQSTEAYIYIFDATLMFIVTALLNWYHPSRILCHNLSPLCVPSSEILAEAHSMEAMRPARYQSY